MIYVLQFDKPLGSGKRGSAQYYVGYADADRVAARVAQHMQGRGAKITQAAVRKGIDITLVAMFEGDRQKEREIKRYKGTRRWLRRNLELAVWVHPFFEVQRRQAWPN